MTTEALTTSPFAANGWMIAGALEQGAATGRGVTFLDGDGGEDRRSWAELHEQALRGVAALHREGIGEGSHVAVMGKTTPDLVVALRSMWLAGAVPCVLADTVLRVPGALARALAAANASALVADASVVAELPEGTPVVPLERLGQASGSPVLDSRTDPASLAALQFTSGSTSDPRPVMVTHDMLAADFDGIWRAASLDPDERWLSWLPLYHDMGLIGFLLMAMTAGAELAIADPSAFVSQPRSWMRWVSRMPCAVTAGPNVSYALAARALAGAGEETLDLSALRVAYNGSEPIDPRVVDGMLYVGARHGFAPGAMTFVYGLAESTAAVSMRRPGAGPAYDEVDRDALERDRVAVARAKDDGGHRLARVGEPLPGIEVRVVDDGGRLVDPGRVGELEVRGRCVTPGYFGLPEASADLFDGGWLRTGDLTYLAGGEIVVCGRSSDVLMIGGRTVYPDVIETAVGDVAGVRPGNVIVFEPDALRGGRVVVVAEASGSYTDRTKSEIARVARDAADAVVSDVVMIRRGTLPRTTSGKLQRSLCRRLYADGALDDRLHSGA